MDMAIAVTVNSKCQRPGVCNAIETLLVDESVAEDFLPRVAEALAAQGVELRVDSASSAILTRAGTTAHLVDAAEDDWHAEYLDLILAVRVVKGVDGALAHINDYGSGHSESIVTSDDARARRFLAEADASAVYWNASTRFTDGGQFGMGAEIGISTDKIGARGPMGLDELTTYKWQITGTGQIRQ